MIEIYSGCDCCPRAHMCKSYMAQLCGTRVECATDTELCGCILQSMVEDSRQEYYSAWFEYIKEFEDHSY